ncbi:MAG: c-type cytochrome [Betaproteobacteria bacterium]|nr:c-type cytochrome [Betaproteobacteria bacterium]
MVAQPGIADGREGARLSPLARLLGGILVATVVVATVAASSAVAGERTQRFALEIAILSSRSNRLLSGGLTTAQRGRLQAKIRSALGVLPLLARECLEEQRRADERPLLARLRTLAADDSHGRTTDLAQGLERLSRRYPVDMQGLLPLPASRRAARAGRTLYDQLCMGCHAYPDARSPAPAPDLFAMAHALSDAQLVVSLLNGVRGTRSTTLVNPLNNQEIADLAAYLKQKEASGP